MREELQKHLDDNCHKLVKQLDIDSGILNRLLARDIITSDHLADIKVINLSYVLKNYGFLIASLFWATCLVYGDRDHM